MTTPRITDPQSFETLTREDVQALMEEGHRLRAEVDRRLRDMRAPSPGMRATRVR